jgi:hypothetical protein
MRASTPSTRLDPVSRLRLPRRATTIRAALVTVLLLTAAGVLYARDDPAPAPVPAHADPPATAAPEPDPTPDPAARLPIPDGLVGVTVPLGDPASLAMLRPGDRVDLLAIPAAGGDPVPLADAAAVLAVDPAAAALLLALTPEQGRAAVSASTTGTFAVIVRP